MAVFNQMHKQVLDELLLTDPAVRPGKMFGYPAYFAGKKLCICIYEDGVGIKLPELVVKRLLDSDTNTVPFQPLGRRRMREWVQINPIHAEDLYMYKTLFQELVQFVGLQQGNSG